jgi:hydrogenase-4 membrane subunit HyfE
MGSLLNEPVVIGTAIRAVLLAAMAFGLNWSAEQLAAIMLAVEAVLALITRALVTPNQLAEQRVAAGGSPTVPQNR